MRDLDGLVRSLAQARKVEAEYKEKLAEVEADIQEDYGPILERAQGFLATARLDVADAEENLREYTVGLYEKSGQKKVHPAVTVKVFKRYEYDPKVAHEYARQHLPQSLKLDKRSFEKAASILGLEFVTIQEEPRATIARDLSGYVE